MRVCIDCQRCFDDSEVYCSADSHSKLSQIREGGLDLVPGYQLDLLLNSDIKGEIYCAHQIASGGRCLITILSEPLKDNGRFLNEAQRASAFFHPNVVDVYEAGRLEASEFFVVSEASSGITLSELFETEPVPAILTTVQIIRQTAEALHALHLSGLTHGAINPQNIIITRDAGGRLMARVKDADLGGIITAQIISNRFHIDSALDALRYFAPEQCLGRGPGEKADIYSLGVVLHEMLAGTSPFNASKPVGLIEQHTNQPPPEVRIDDYELRMLLTHTLTESLRKEPELRIASANTFARQMRHMEQLKTHTSVPPPPTTSAAVPFRSAAVVRATVARADPAADALPTAESEAARAPKHEIIRPPAVRVELTPVEVIGAKYEAAVALDGRSGTRATRRSRLKILKKKVRFLLMPRFSRSAALPPVLAEPQHEEAPALQPSPQEMPNILPRMAEVVMPRVPSAKIDWEHSEYDIPSEMDVLEAISEQPVIEDPDATVEVPFDPVITLVSARTANVRTSHDPELGFAHFEDIDTSTRSPQKVVLLPPANNVPVISNVTHIDRRDLIFSGSYGQTSSRYRIGKIAAAAAVLTGVVFVGRFVVDEKAAVNNPVERPAVSNSESFQRQAAPPVAASRDLPSVPDAPTTAIGPATDLERSTVTELPTAKDTRSIAKERTRETAAARITKGKTPDSGRIGQNTVTTSPTMSTVVITYGGDKIATRIEPGGGSPSTKPSINTRKTGEVTRPRVVKEPRR